MNPPRTPPESLPEDITGRKAADTELRISRDYCLELFDDFPNPIRQADRNGKCDHVNKEWLAFTGRAAEQETGDGWMEGVHPEDLDRCVKTYRAAFHAREPFTMDYRLRHRDGTYHWLHDNGKPFYDAEGTIAGYIGSCYDITGSKTAEEALRLQNQIFGTIAEGVYLIRARDGVIVYTNAKFDTMFGYENGELLGKHVSVVNAPGEDMSPRDMAEEIMKALNEKGEWRGEVKNIRKDGTTFWCLAIVSTFEHPEFGNVWISAHTDITGRRQAEEALQESGQEWQTTFNAITDVVFLLDSRGRIVRHNHAFEAFIGKAGNEVDGQYCYNIMHGTYYPIDGCPFVTAQVSRQRENLELKIGDRWFVASVDPVFSGTGTFSGAVHLMRDITERKHADEALRLAYKKLGMLSSITRHDIQNQITALRGYLELSQGIVKDNRLLDIITREDKIADTISRQIEFSRYYEDLGMKAPEWQDVRDRILSAHSNLREGDHIDVSIGIPPVQVYADALIEKVFYNLMENSIRHGGHVTRVVFSFRKTSDSATIIYEDNGVGIAPDSRQYLFRKGFGKNTGLGMFLSQEILAITGLTIRENGEPGKGVRFEITVPNGKFRFPGGEQECS